MSVNISYTTQGFDTGEEDLYLLPTPVLVPVVIIIVVLILMAVMGNLLVIISYLRDRSLRTIYNIYIFNLAIADMFLGFSSMGLYIVYTVMVFHWPLGRAMCKIFLCVDFTLCLETVLLMIILSLDRLILITAGADYNQRETRRVAYIKVTVSWIFAFSLYGPAIIGWDYWVGESAVADDDCDTEFNKNFEYTLATATVEFVIPFVSIIVLNTLTYLKIRQRNKIFCQTDQIKSSTVRTVTSTIESPSYVSANSSVSAGGNNPDAAVGIHPGIVGGNNPGSVGGNSSGGVDWNNPAKVACNIPASVAANDSNSPASVDADNSKRAGRHSRDRKAAKTLSFLVIVFAICWTPYTMVIILKTVCEACVNKNVLEFLVWLLWTKSCVNPFLYAYTNVRFRENFRKLFSCFVLRRRID
ncbi:muscarinic acetylcholine receptor M4-like [Gigantopelta aegis]|uniref:muscarinic acetylcholine receptor M4-like n=1 Tax=Gigantopelta aegis TaxID=1735272 RepID=UPI001B88A923|nr:muscarinic acetylcholine receptor M4-like [Gigantopelta aegis]